MSERALQDEGMASFSGEGPVEQRGWMALVLEEAELLEREDSSALDSRSIAVKQRQPLGEQDMQPDVDLYERIVAPENKTNTQYAVPASIVGDNELVVNGETVTLEGHRLFVFNALMLCRENPKITRKDILGLGFYPDASDAARANAFNAAINKVTEYINTAAGRTVIHRSGIKRGSSYRVDADFGIADATDVARQRPVRITAPPKRVKKAELAAQTSQNIAIETKEGSEKESLRRDRIISKLIRTYDGDPTVERMLKLYKKRDAKPVTAGTDEPLKRYLQEAAQYKLLTAKQEVQLAKMIRKGLETYDAISKEGRTSPTLDEKKLLVNLVAAHQVMVMCNRRLVVSIAKKFLYAQSASLSFGDLISEGNIGLIKGVRRFDERKGFKVSTYATLWIRQNIQRAIADQGRTVRLPVHIDTASGKARRFMLSYEQEYGELPDMSEIAKHLKRSEEQVAGMLQFARFGLDSLDSPIKPDSSTTQGELLEDTSSHGNMDKQINLLSDQEELNLLLKEAPLSDEELVILGLRWGVETAAISRAISSLEGQGHDLSVPADVNRASTVREGLSHDAIGRMLGVSRAVINKKEKQALDKIERASTSPGSLGRLALDM